MKQRIFQVITSLLLIITLTMANFLLLCVDVVALAADEINADKSTNHKNIEFMAYFKDEKGNKITEIDSYANSDNLKLYFQISVKQEGYFVGNIVLNNSNFKFKTDILSNEINKIENNVVYLNQINAGESKEIKIGIELLNDDQFDLNMINMKNEISIEGIYRDSTQKDISIKAERNVTLNLISPYVNAEETITLSQEIITNKVLEFNGNSKRIIQIEVKSGLNNNLFPIKKSIVNIKVPKISDIYPEGVLVNSNNILTTNGKMLSKDNWNYDKETGLITIDIENETVDNKVSWLKTGEDTFVVTYVFDKDVNINNEELNVNSQIELYDKKATVATASDMITLIKSEKDTIVKSSVIQNETSIYKGKLYAGISRDITYKNIIDINLNNVADEISVKEERYTINEQVISSVYKESRINRSNIENILGESGSLEIINAENGNVVATINKDTQADENGNIVIVYPENITMIVIKLLSPEKIGKLEIETVKTINSIDKNTVKNANNIVQKNSTSYLSNNKESNLDNTESSITLNESETSADLEISRTELSTMITNKNVEFRITLKNKDENNELFKNPVLKLELPEKIQNINVNSINLLYEDEMKIEKATLTDNTIEIIFSGEQTKYKEATIDGAIIIINADLTTSTKIPSSTEQVKLTYTNQNAINYKDSGNCGIAIKDINIVSYAGVITTNQIGDYGINVINNEGTKSAKLQVSSEEKNITIQKNIINNKENKISNVKILGVLPTKDATNVNNIDIQVGKVSVSNLDSSRVKVYYSTNANATEDLEDTNNAWTENLDSLQDVKKYLVVIDELNILEEVVIEYQAVIPANLEYNEEAEEGYNVYYNDSVTSVSENVKLDNIKLSTGAGAVANTNLKVYAGSEEATDVKEGQILKYELTVSNTGTEDITNLQLVGKVPENTVYVEKNKMIEEMTEQEDNWEPFVEYQDKTSVGFNIEKISVGETISKTYQVKVKDGTAGNKITNSVTMKYGEVNKVSNEVVNNINKAEIQTVLYPVDSNGILESGYSYRYVLKVVNKSDKEKKNIQVNAMINDIVELKEIYYITRDGDVVTEKDKDFIIIDSMNPGESIKVALLVKAKSYTDNEILNDIISTKVIDNGETYNSNAEDMLVKALDIEAKISSQNSDSYVKSGDTIEYDIIVKNNGNIKVDNLSVKNIISDKITVSEVMKNGEQLTTDEYSKDTDSTTGERIVIISDKLESGEQVEYKIKVLVDRIPGNTKSIEIINDISIYANDSVEIMNKNIKHILQPEETNSENPDKPNNPENPENPDGDKNVTNTKSISGTVWVDENQNGGKDSGEELLKGVNVKLLDVKTNSFVKDIDENELTTKTNENGFYSFDKVKVGEYIVIFEYDTSKYILTAYEKEGIDNNSNSKVINKTLLVDGKEVTVGSTEIIKINSENIANINMGLQIAKNYDLKLDKYISKVVIQNSKGTITNEYDNTTFAKAEIDSKQLNNTTAVVEYIIKVTNVGEVDAYAKKIIDYISKDYKFTSELNKDWYQSGDNLYNSSLSNEKIKPGESKEVKLIVTKQMTENNTGLIHNTAEIIESYNELGLKDGNKNDSNSADLILSIKTGQVVTTITLILSTIVIIGAAVYIISKIILNKRII